MKRNSLFKLGLFSMLAMLCTASGASRKKEITLVMVPRGSVAEKIGLDLAGRYPTLLLRYEVAHSGAVALNGWTGHEWVRISLPDFQSGSFFNTGPASALMVRPQHAVFPQALIPPAAWVDTVYQISTLEPRPLLHLTGRFYPFKFAEWQDFSKRYSLPLDAINPDGLNVAWYHRRLNEHLSKRGKPEVSDLKYWSIVRLPPPPPAPLEPAESPSDAVAEEQAVDAVAEEMAVEAAPASPLPAAAAAAEHAQEPEAVAEPAASVPKEEKTRVDPFSEEAPAALILSAGDAVEDTDEKSIHP